MSDNKNKKKEIKVITGNGSDLDISDVYDHVKIDNNTSENDNKKKEIVIPKGSSSNKDTKK